MDLIRFIFACFGIFENIIYSHHLLHIRFKLFAQIRIQIFDLMQNKFIFSYWRIIYVLKLIFANLQGNPTLRMLHPCVVPSMRDAVQGQGHNIQGTLCPRGATSKNFRSGTHQPCIVITTICMQIRVGTHRSGMHSPGDLLPKGHDVQRTYRTWDATQGNENTRRFNQGHLV
jgi:hypothetical protein